MMEYFVQIAGDGKTRGTWAVGDGSAKRLGIANPEKTRNAYVEAQPGESDLDALQRVIPIWFPTSDPFSPDKLYKITRAPGEYYPRMARPNAEHLYDSPGIYPGDNEAASEMAMAHDQIIVLADRLGDICRTIHPNGDNLKAYGHEIRNLLILACTEAEAYWRGILVANHVCKQSARLSTNDYVKLAAPMKLREYGVYFSSYPWMPILHPYATWGTTGSPTKDLPWYDAYNSVKHDREGKFPLATLSCAFDAVAACFVMLFAQYGINQRQSLRAKGLHLMNVVKVPVWAAEDSYLRPFDFSGVIPSPCPIIPVDYPF
ncbi:MAG: hypothetical protein B7Z75_13235 [Acidocella sp. 20-57-95]|nr:MAG: hypothetical protein B7Z75_13235 [Acidocella sp. 20-57-95]HQT65752.1 hypothetical protein [Acidocella sp.]